MVFLEKFLKICGNLSWSLINLITFVYTRSKLSFFFQIPTFKRYQKELRESHLCCDVNFNDLLYSPLLIPVTEQQFVFELPDVKTVEKIMKIAPYILTGSWLLNFIYLRSSNSMCFFWFGWLYLPPGWDVLYGLCTRKFWKDAAVFISILLTLSGRNSLHVV